MSSLDIPEIRINFSWLFYNDVCRQLDKVQKWDLPSGEQCEEWTEAYRNEWSKHETKILTAMQNITGLNFYKSVIDVTTAPGVIPKSEPLFMSFYDTPKSFVDTLTHELIHVLLTDNTTLSIYGENRSFRLGAAWEKLFGIEDDFSCLVHIPVHAIHKKIFCDVLNDPKGVDRDIELNKKFDSKSYLKSWDYVEKEGHEVIIEKLKKSYADIAKKLEKKS